MKITRRSVLGILAGATALHPGEAGATGGIPEIAPGPFAGTRASLKQYQAPEWFADAKLGIWAHWGPQSAAEYGDWYARRMYEEGSPQYKYHVKTYGHPSQFGYKDLCRSWKAGKFDAEHLMDLYQKAGAKYFVSMGVHHDNFDLWKSKHQPVWNSAATGPRQDIVGLFRQAALKRGLKFGVSEHLGPSYHWFGPSYGADKTGPYAGVPYDGRDPRYAALYHPFHEIPERRLNGPKVLDDPATMPDSWKREYVLRLQDLIDNYEPDLLYTDGPIRYEEWGLATIAHLFNRSAQRHQGKIEAVYNAKGVADCATGTCVLDLERGSKDRIWEKPWQTDTCIGEFHYNRERYTNDQYKSPKIVVDLLVDIVSRNGNLLLNFPLRSDGTLDEKELAILGGITTWMAVNGEAIHGTRPWKVFGEGPGTLRAADGRYNESTRKELTSQDIRFTTKRSTLYAFLMGWPGKQASVAALAENGKYAAGKIRNVELLGHQGKLKWSQNGNGLTVDLPEQKPGDHAITLKVALA